MARGLRHSASRIRDQTYHFWNTLLGRYHVHMLHVGKTGGTAIKAALRQIPTRSDFRLQLHTHRGTLRDVPVGDKVFFFVRDPIARFVSGFYSRQRQGQPRYSSPWTPAEAVAFARFDAPNALGGALASGDAAARTAAIAAMKGIRHVNSSYWDWFHDPAYFQMRLSDILFIGFQESLEHDFRLLKSLLNLPPNLQLPTDDAISHRSPPGLDRKLDDMAVAALRAWYAADFEFVDLCRSVRSRWDLRECA